MSKINEALRLIADIAEGSTTANSLQHIAKIAREALAERPAQHDPWPHKWGCRANAFGECNMGCTSPQPTQQEPVAWYESMAELAVVYGEMCAINETPSKDQTQEQKDRLRVLRAECVAVHYRRITLNTSSQPSKLMTDEQRKAIVVCFTSGKVSVSEVQRKLAISYNEAQKLCQSIVDLGLAEGLQLAPSLNRHGIKGDA